MKNITAENYIGKTPASSLDEKIADIRRIVGNTADLTINRAERAGVRFAAAGLDGMISSSEVSKMIFLPLMSESFPADTDARAFFRRISENMMFTLDKSVQTDYGGIIDGLMSGFAVIMADGISEVLMLGVQGYAARSISEPSSEGNITGARDGFVETVRTNMSLIRRRLKSPLLRFELFPVSQTGRTDILIAYISGRVPQQTVRDIRRRLENMPPEAILGSGTPEAFVSKHSGGLFSGISTTERPDVMCAALLEGRVGIVIDGTPFALIVPALFSDNFTALDDYNFKPYYAAFIRLIRYAAFIVSVFLPGVYCAVTMHHREILRREFLMNLAAAEKTAPLPIAAEALIILIFYEVIREAGIRLPKNVGGAVSIIGGLVIGDTAVSAGIITDPMLLVCAISVIGGFVIPSLNQPVSILRLICTAAGGLFGMYGTALAAAVIITAVCTPESYGVPITSPVSPFTKAAMNDLFIRAGHGKLAESKITVEEFNGVNMTGNTDTLS